MAGENETLNETNNREDDNGTFNPYFKDVSDKDGYDGGLQQRIQDKSDVKLHVPIGVVAFLLLILVLVVVSMRQFPKVFNDYKIYNKAEERVRNGETSATIMDLYEVVERHPDSLPIVVKLVDVAMENGYYDIAGHVVKEYLVGEELEDSTYNRIDRYMLKLDRYYNTYDRIETILSTLPEQGMADEAYMEGIKQQMLSLLEDRNTDKPYVYYMLGMIESDGIKAREYLQQSFNLDAECFDIRVRLAVIIRRQGDTNQAKRYVEDALRKDKQDVGALRAMSTILLAEGDLPQGLKYAEEAYTQYAEGDYVRDTYLVALHANDRREEARAIKEEMLGLNQTLDEDTVRFLEDKMTLEEYYIGE